MDFERVDVDRIRTLSLEELMEINVTTVAGSPREWFRTPAAITVLTAEDIARAGHQSIPEALRLVPGMFVGRSSSHFWKAGSRGFTGAALPAPRNLVLIDGRTVYDPLFGGVFWDVQDVPIADIDRIEVIRGPGATLWGPNAVNGVINVITKDARKTAGTLLQGGGGTHERAFGTARHGRSFERGAIRIYAVGFEREGFEAAGARPDRDAWSMLRGGFRADARIGATSELSVQGAYYGSLSLAETRRVPVANRHLAYERLEGDDEVDGGHLLARMSGRIADSGGWSAQTYYDYTSRTRLGGLAVDRNTFDLDLRSHLPWRDRHEVAWGAGLRATRDDAEAGRDVVLDPLKRTLRLFSGFVQNTTAILSERLHLAIGSKLTHHTITGWEGQPSARIWWTPNHRHTVWGAVSRPVRHPTRVELDAFFVLGIVDRGRFSGGEPTGVYVPLGVTGEPSLVSERLVAYELGYRTRPAETLTLDTALYYNAYSRLISAPAGQIGRFNNDGSGISRGVEAAASWRPLGRWRLQAQYAFTEVDHNGPVLQFEDRVTPRHLAAVRSDLDLTRAVGVHATAYHVSRIAQNDIPESMRLDAGITWHASRRFSLALWGQNLLEPGIREISSLEFPRSAYLEVTLRP